MFAAMKKHFNRFFILTASCLMFSVPASADVNQAVAQRVEQEIAANIQSGTKETVQIYMGEESDLSKRDLIDTYQQITDDINEKYFSTFSEGMSCSCICYPAYFVYDGATSQETLGSVGAIETEAKKMCKAAGVKKNMSAAKKVKKIHNYILHYLSYQEGQSSVEEAIRTRRGNCTTYTQLFCYMCKVSGIQTRYVYGTGDGSDHAWNRVKIKNRWYYIDCCWDDSTDSTSYYLSKRLWADHEKDGEMNL